MAVALDRSVVTQAIQARVEVDRETAQTHMRADGEPQCEIVVEASGDRFRALLRDALRG
jgi:hypothetical protein